MRECPRDLLNRLDEIVADFPLQWQVRAKSCRLPELDNRPTREWWFPDWFVHRIETFRTERIE